MRREKRRRRKKDKKYSMQRENVRKRKEGM
jgi:hypothetical protein